MAGNRPLLLLTPPFNPLQSQSRGVLLLQSALPLSISTRLLFTSVTSFISRVRRSDASVTSTFDDLTCEPWAKTRTKTVRFFFFYLGSLVFVSVHIKVSCVCLWTWQEVVKKHRNLYVLVWYMRQRHDETDYRRLWLNTQRETCSTSTLTFLKAPLSHLIRLAQLGSLVEDPSDSWISSQEARVLGTHNQNLTYMQPHSATWETLHWLYLRNKRGGMCSCFPWECCTRYYIHTCRAEHKEVRLI